MDLHRDEQVKAKIDRWSAWTSLGVTYQKCLFRANTKYRKEKERLSSPMLFRSTISDASIRRRLNALNIFS